MAKDASFDIVSEFDQQELLNALDQTRREIGSRFDLKDSGSELELEEGVLKAIGKGASQARMQGAGAPAGF